MSSMELYRTARRIVEDKFKQDGKTLYGPDYVIVHEYVADDFMSTVRTILMNSSKLIRKSAKTNYLLGFGR